MRREDYGEFYALMEQALDLTVMPNGKDPERVITTLFAALAPYPLELVREAVIAHCRSEKFFPMLADIVRRIDGTAEERAAVAWAALRDAIRRHTAESIKFSSPAMHYAIKQMGGWLKLCYMSSRELDFREKTFAMFYSIGERKASWDGANGTYKVPNYFLGECDLSNRLNGYEKIVPIKILELGTGNKIDVIMLESGERRPELKSQNDIKQLTQKIAKII